MSGRGGGKPAVRLKNTEKAQTKRVAFALNLSCCAGICITMPFGLDKFNTRYRMLALSEVLPNSRSWLGPASFNVPANLGASCECKLNRLEFRFLVIFIKKVGFGYQKSTGMYYWSYRFSNKWFILPSPFVLSWFNWFMGKPAVSPTLLARKAKDQQNRRSLFWFLNEGRNSK